MEFYAVIEHEGRYYSWQKTSGETCRACDFHQECWVGSFSRYQDIRAVCAGMRQSVGSSVTHRFKEVHLET